MERVLLAQVEERAIEHGLDPEELREEAEEVLAEIKRSMRRRG